MNGNYAVWSLLGSLAQPVFQGGRLRRQVDIARSHSEEALEIYTDAVLQAFGEVETALSVESLLRERLRELEESAAEARAARKGNYNLYYSTNQYAIWFVGATMVLLRFVYRSIGYCGGIFSGKEVFSM